MEAFEILAYFIGVAILALAIGGAVYLVNKSRPPKPPVIVNMKDETNPDYFFNALEKRMARRGFDQGPMWTYKETLTERTPKPQTGKMGAQPKTGPGEKPSDTKES